LGTYIELEIETEEDRTHHHSPQQQVTQTLKKISHERIESDDRNKDTSMGLSGPELIIKR
jgi:hypothetical protein